MDSSLIPCSSFMNLSRSQRAAYALDCLIPYWTPNIEITYRCSGNPTLKNPLYCPDLYLIGQQEEKGRCFKCDFYMGTYENSLFSKEASLEKACCSVLLNQMLLLDFFEY